MLGFREDCALSGFRAKREDVAHPETSETAFSTDPLEATRTQMTLL